MTDAPWYPPEAVETVVQHLRCPIKDCGACRNDADDILTAVAPYVQAREEQAAFRGGIVAAEESVKHLNSAIAKAHADALEQAAQVATRRYAFNVATEIRALIAPTGDAALDELTRLSQEMGLYDPPTGDAGKGEG